MIENTKPTKAIWGAAVAALTAGLTALVAALSDDVVTAAEWAGIALAVVGSAGATGGAVYAVTNKPRF